MTWVSNIVDQDGNNRDCFTCKHIDSCQVFKVAHTLGSVLTSVDTCCDGHMASGSADLKCDGFEDKEPVDSQDSDGDGAGQGQDGVEA